MGTVAVHGSPVSPQWWWISWGFTPKTCRTSSMPEEEAAVLGDIKPDIKQDIKHDIELPQVPEQLEICEQIQPAEQTAAPTASLPSPPSQPSPLPSQKARKPQKRTTRADTISATQWVWAYLEENYRVSKWWREFWPLLQCPCDSTIQTLAHQQVTAFQKSTTQLEKDRWWIAPPCMEVLGQRKYLPQKFSMGAATTEKWRGKKQLPRLWLFQAVLCDLEHPQECYMKWCRSSANVLSPSLRKTVS